MKEMVMLTQKEQVRLKVLNQVGVGDLEGRQAAEMLGISLRHLRRLLAAYRKEGATAIAHGNRRRKPSNTLETYLKEQVVKLAQAKYAGFNTLHFTEFLTEQEGVNLSRSSVRRILLSAGIRSPRKRRPPRHRSRRERYPQEGMLLQIDGSRHDWLEGRGPWLTLIGAIDDATGNVAYALFREQEDAQGYFLLLRYIVQHYGIPGALYHDCHTIFVSPEKEPMSLEEQLEGKKWPTQFGRVMQELGITSISAHSPQAKGRVERMWGTFQDRLVSELRLARARTYEEANQVLWKYLPRHNRRFAIPAAQSGSAFRKPEHGFKPEEVFCFKYYRTVGADNVVRLGEHRIQITPSNGRLSYARARVEVQERLDGSLAVYYQGKCLATKPAPPEAPLLRARKTRHPEPAKVESPETTLTGVPSPLHSTEKPTHYKPALDHPWRRSYKVHIDRG